MGSTPDLASLLKSLMIHFGIVEISDSLVVELFAALARDGRLGKAESFFEGLHKAGIHLEEFFVEIGRTFDKRIVIGIILHLLWPIGMSEIQSFLLLVVSVFLI